ncbi:MAG: bifunctional diguanylate cyclase/phosphodiesterase [Pseudomonadota bacterium]
MTLQAPGHQAYDLAVLEELSHRLLESLPDCLAVVLVDSAEQQVLLTPREFVDRSWLPPNPITKRRAFTTHRTRHGMRYCCFEVPLIGERDATMVATVHLRFSGDQVKEYQDAIDRASEIFDCIRQYMMISREISSVQLVGVSIGDSVSFLAELDRAITASPVFGVVPQLLSMCKQHLGASLIALLCPKLNQLVTAPSIDDTGAEQKTQWMRVLGRLHTHALKRQRVLISEDRDALDTLQTGDDPNQMLVSIPVLARESENIASLTLVSPTQLSRAEIQLLRAVAVKISGLLMQTKPAGRTGSRLDFIESIDADIRKSPAASRCLMLLDIDRMHLINDRIGHRRGDEIIAAVSDIVSKASVDLDGHALFNGDVGYIYLPDSDEAKAMTLAKSLQAAVAHLTAQEDLSGSEITLSVGIALIPEHAHDGSQALNVAELALRSAKSRGGKQALVYQNLDQSIVQRRSDLAEISNLQSALLQDRFVLYAQPIRPIHRSAGNERYEILTRMLGPGDTLIQPNKFLSAAERYQMMPAMDRWVVAQTLKQLSSAENVLEVNFSSYSINIAAQTLADKDFIDFLLAAVANSGLSPDCLCFEITESTAIRSFERAEHFVRSVQQAGCSVALDDFGAGYCSFGYLESLPVDVIKLDGRFVRNLCESSLNEVIVKAVVDIAAVISATTVAEFVQDDMTLAKLRELGVNFAQGYGVAQPEPLEDVLARMESPVSLGLTGTVETTMAARTKTAS